MSRSGASLRCKYDVNVIGAYVQSLAMVAAQLVAACPSWSRDWYNPPGGNLNANQSWARIYGSGESRSAIHRLPQAGAGIAQMRRRRHSENRLHEYLRERSTHGAWTHDSAARPDSWA